MVGLVEQVHKMITQEEEEDLEELVKLELQVMTLDQVETQMVMIN